MRSAPPLYQFTSPQLAAVPFITLHLGVSLITLRRGVSAARLKTHVLLTKWLIDTTLYWTEGQ